MFKFLKIIVSAVIFIIVLALIIYFLPRETKIKAVQALTKIVPDSFKERVEEIILTPPEEREKLLRKLEDNLGKFKSVPISEENAALIEDSEKVLEKLKEKNEAASLTEIIAQKFADQLVKEIAGTGTTTIQCAR